MMKTFKKRCLALRREGRTLPEIVEITGRPKTTVYFHIKDIALPPYRVAQIRRSSGERIRQYALARKGKSTRPFKRISAWSPKVALLLGHLLFDGEIQRGVCSYNNRSEALIERFTHLMTAWYEYEPSINRNLTTGVVRASYFNVELAAHFRECAHELLREVEVLPHDLQREFLRAFFDDEGCMDFRPKENRRQVRGYQKDARILHIVRHLLEKFHITSKINQPNEVVISGKDNLKQFEREINFSPGVSVNGNRSNSRWKKHIEKRKLLRMAIQSFKN